LKIAFYSPAWPAGSQANGVVTYVGTMVPKLRQMGHEVYVITPDAKERDEFTINLKEYEKPPSYFRRALFKISPRLALFKSQCEPLISAVKMLVRERGLQVIEIEESFGWNLALSKLKLLPVVVRLHGPWFINKRHQDADREKRERRGVEGASFVTSPSKIILDQTKAHYGDDLPGNATIPNPIKPPKQRWRLDGCRKNSILYVGRFDDIKGAPLVLKAFNTLALQNQHLTLTFIGPDIGVLNDAGHLEKFETFVTRVCAKATIRRIDFRGAVSHEQILPLRINHFLTICASNSEVLPYAVLEAMSLGCPIVTTDAGGIPELIRNGENGLLVPRNDLSAFVSSCRNLLENPEKAASFGERAMYDCAEFYNVDAIAAKTADTFAKLL
jgi:glycosyltransferase involved in cell wall biosynthesis